ncbi:zinc-binding protein A33-like isoform X3 [Macrobrachium rosenbergii]|uniref:zinc-binding protein A33-like isoform X3 n=1 Tax=Macrobrachium rosenbergii TaxID=79674 RepID=UPI0034D76AB6
MAAGNSRELCSVCLERFDHDVRPPVALLCGHSFCRPCLVYQCSSHSPLQCPKCSRIHEGEHPRDLPINYLLLSVIERVTDNREEPNVSVEQREEEPKKRLYCKESDSSDSDSDEENCKDGKINILDKEAKKENDKDKAAEPILRSPVEDDKDQLILNISPATSKPKAVYKRKIFLVLAVIIAAILIGLASCYVIAPAILRGWGFTEKGAKSKSYASQLMSEAYKKHGKIPKDSWNCPGEISLLSNFMPLVMSRKGGTVLVCM